MQTALHFYFDSESFAACAVETVNQGDDADTTGTLAAMLAGATYAVSAIPSGWLARLDRRIAAEIRDQTPRLLAIAESISGH